MNAKKCFSVNFIDTWLSNALCMLIWARSLYQSSWYGVCCAPYRRTSGALTVLSWSQLTPRSMSISLLLTLTWFLSCFSRAAWTTSESASDWDDHYQWDGWKNPFCLEAKTIITGKLRLLEYRIFYAKHWSTLRISEYERFGLFRGCRALRHADCLYKHL